MVRCLHDAAALERETGGAFPDYSISTGVFSLMLPLALRTLRHAFHQDVVRHGRVIPRRFVEVRRSMVRGRIETPKSGQLRRVDMSKHLALTMKELLRQRKEAYLEKGEALPEWVFINSDGSPLDQHNFRKRVYVGLLAKAGIRQIRFHDLRHTFASLLLQQGESLTYVKDQMGHHSIQVTVDIYGHLIPGSNKQAVDRLDYTPASAATA
jgi:integrase